MKIQGKYVMYVLIEICSSNCLFKCTTIIEKRSNFYLLSNEQE